MKPFIISLLSLACVNTACHMGCINRGYDGGFYHNQACLCFDALDYEALVHKNIYRAPPKSDNPPAYQLDERTKIKYDSD